MPLSHHAWVRAELNRAWAMADAGEAERALRNLADEIGRAHPDAASSLREGLKETVTINRLGVTGMLARTLSTTNPMEPTIAIVRSHARNVKRWAPGDMRLRWAAAGMLAAQSQYRRVQGYRQLDRLAKVISAKVQSRTELADAG